MNKHELRQIIREEVSKVLNENLDGTLYKWGNEWVVSYTTSQGDIKGDYAPKLDPSQKKYAEQNADLIRKNNGMDVKFKLINGKAHLLDITPSYKIGDNVKFKNGEVWKVVSPGVKGNKIFLAPSNAIAKRDHVSIAIEFTSDELKDTVIE